MPVIKRPGNVGFVNQAGSVARIPQSDAASVADGAERFAAGISQVSDEWKRKFDEQQRAQEDVDASTRLTNYQLQLQEAMTAAQQTADDSQLVTYDANGKRTNAFFDAFDREHLQPAFQAIQQDKSLSPRARARVLEGLNQLREGAFSESSRFVLNRQAGNAALGLDQSYNAASIMATKNPSPDAALSLRQNQIAAATAARPIVGESVYAAAVKRADDLPFVAGRAAAEDDRLVRALANDLKNPKSAWYNALQDGEQRNQLLAYAESRVHALDAAAHEGQAASQAILRSQLDDAQRAYEATGNPNLAADIVSMARRLDTSKAEGALAYKQASDVVDRTAVASRIADLPFEQREATMAALRARAMQGDVSPAEVLATQAADKMISARIKAISDGGVDAYAQIRGIALIPFSAGTNTEALAQRTALHAQAQAYAPGVRVSFLSRTEAQQLANGLASGDLATVKRQLAGVSQAPRDAQLALQGQFAAMGHGELSVALGMLSDQGATPDVMDRVAGMVAGARSTGGVDVTLMRQSLPENYVRALARMNIGGQPAIDVYMRAAMGLAVSRQYTSGRATEIDPKHMDPKAVIAGLREILGEPVYWRGEWLVRPNPGVDQRQFERGIAAMTDADLLRAVRIRSANGATAGVTQLPIVAGAGASASRLSSGMLRSAVGLVLGNDGLYYLTHPNGHVLSPRGDPQGAIAVDLDAYFQAKRGGTGIPGPMLRTEPGGAPPRGTVVPELN